LPTSLSSSTTTVTKKLAKRQQLLPSDTSDETLEEMLEEIAEEEHVKSEAFDDMLAEIQGSSVPVAATLNEDDEPVSASSDEYASAVDPYSHGEWDGSVLDFSNGFQRGGSSSGNDTDGHNGTSIFQPEDGSGLLHRYALFSPALIVGASPDLFSSEASLALLSLRADPPDRISCSRPHHVRCPHPNRHRRGSSPPVDRDG
jgi:hypothetical protein